MKRICIAVDGPAGAGKSTVAKTTAQKLKILYLDTGAMYRAVALYAIRRGIDLTDSGAVCDMLKDVRVNVKNIDMVQHTYLNGEDVSEQIRTQEVSKGASDIAVIPCVRLMLVEVQRDFAESNDVIMDGRDIGTFVMPDAPYKFYVTASVSERAKRRLLEMQRKGKDMGKSLDEVEREIALRDKTDSTREFAPLRIADGAKVIDTTEMSIDQAVDTMLKYIGG